MILRIDFTEGMDDDSTVLYTLMNDEDKQYPNLPLSEQAMFESDDVDKDILLHDGPYSRFIHHKLELHSVLQFIAQFTWKPKLQLVCTTKQQTGYNKDDEECSVKDDIINTWKMTVGDIFSEIELKIYDGALGLWAKRPGEFK